MTAVCEVAGGAVCFPPAPKRAGGGTAAGTEGSQPEEQHRSQQHPRGHLQPLTEPRSAALKANHQPRPAQLGKADGPAAQSSVEFSVVSYCAGMARSCYY